MRACFLSLSILLVTSVAAYADALPKGAKDLTAEELTALYSGKSFQWDKDNAAYFAPDGTVTSTFSFNGSRGYTVGTWKVTGNEICKNTAQWFDVTKNANGKGSPDCWRWVKKGKTYYTLWSTRFDGSKPDENAWNSGENKKLKKGDLVTKTIDAMKSGS